MFHRRDINFEQIIGFAWLLSFVIDLDGTMMVRNIWELGEFSKVQKFQSLARMLTIHLSFNSYGIFLHYA